MDVIFKPIKNTLSFLDQPLIYFALRFALIFYAITLIPKITDDIIAFIESPIGKLILFSVIMLIYVKDQSLALLFAFVLIVTIIDYHNGTFPSVVVDTSGRVVGKVLTGTSDIASDVGEAGAKLVGVSGEATGDIIKTVGKGSADAVAVISGAAEDIIRTSANVTGDVTKDITGTVKRLGTQEDENVVEAFDGGCTACMM